MRELRKRQTSYSFPTVVKRILVMAFAAGPVYIIVNNLIAMVNGVSQGVITYMTQLFFDTVTRCAGPGAGVRRAALMALALIGTIVAAHIVNGLNNFMGTSYFKKVTGYLHGKINEKAARIRPIAYENPETLDDINKASLGADNSLGLLFTITTIFTYYTPYFLFMFFYLFSLDRVLAVTLIFIFVPVMASQLVRSVVFSKLEDKVAPIRRESEYYKTAFGDKETRTLGVFSYFDKRYVNTLRRMNKAVWKAEKKAGLLELGMKVLTLAGYLMILLLFVRSLLKGTISVGQFAAVFASVQYMFNTMNVIICTHIADLTKNMGTMNNFLRFLDMPEKEGSDAEKDPKLGIRFDNVTFAYPKTNRPALCAVNIGIKGGETVAIVGENGSGKSTFAKLALGIYEPVSGTVEIGGRSTKDISAKAIYHRASAVFQNFQKYKMTLGDNVAISDPADEDPGRIRKTKNTDENPGQVREVSDADEKYRRVRKVPDADEKSGRFQEASEVSSNPTRIKEALEMVELDTHTNTFPKGTDTMLSREFGGVELSGGQWQKTAIARGLYRGHDVIVLDEPTAAIDPMQEADLYREFAEISKDKTALIITHRLGSARIADRIIVMKSGGIQEVGTHEELMKKKGHYYDMFQQQAKWYRA